MSTHLININDCTTPYDGAAGFSHLMPLSLYPTQTPKETPRKHLLPKDAFGWPTTYKLGKLEVTNSITMEKPLD